MGTLYAIWGSSSNDVWAVGENGTMVHWDGKTWQALGSYPGSVADTFGAVNGSSAGDVWALGVTAVHWDGAAWTTSPTYAVMGAGAWGTGPDDVWVVGRGGYITHWDGALWSLVPSTITTDLFAVWGSGPDDVWATGDVGVAMHWNGSAWSAKAPPGVEPLHGLWGSSATDVWAVGITGVVNHWNGAAWSSSGSGLTVRAVSGSGPSDVWAVGTGPMMHYDGNVWSLVTNPVGGLLDGVWTHTPADAWAVGAGGQIPALGRQDLVIVCERGDHEPERGVGQPFGRGLGGRRRRHPASQLRRRTTPHSAHVHVCPPSGEPNAGPQLHVTGPQ